MNKLNYNPATDLHEVDQVGFVNLADAFERGIIPASVQMDDSSFNGVSVPGTLISRYDDVFAGMRQASYVSRVIKDMTEKQKKEAEKQLEKVTPPSEN